MCALVEHINSSCKSLKCTVNKTLNSWSKYTLDVRQICQIGGKQLSSFFVVVKFESAFYVPNVAIT